MIWAKTSSRRGGAKDPAAAPAARVGHVMEELADLDEGGEAAALMSAEGFKAYADDSIWVSMSAGRGACRVYLVVGCVCVGGGVAALMSTEGIKAYAVESVPGRCFTGPRVVQLRSSFFWQPALLLPITQRM